MNVWQPIKWAITHPYAALVFRIYIAGLFIYAGVTKINYLAEFAETIASYGMVPYWAVNAMAVALPWIELICGVLLFCGIRVRTTSFVLGALLAGFTLGIALNLIWQTPIDCGCFHTLDDTISWKTLVRDLIWLAMTGHVYLYDKTLQLEGKIDWITKEIK